MTTDTETFNKRCAEALGCQDYHIADGVVPLFKNCPSTIRDLVRIKFYDPKIHLSDMHFHDSYDWSGLLEQRVVKAGWDYEIYYHDNCGYLDIRDGDGKSVIHVESIESLLTPRQISEACLEVLENA